MLHSKSQHRRNRMTARTTAILALILAVASLEAAAISKQQADLFSKKVAQIVVQGDAAQKPGTRRTPVTEAELNSWFAYSAQPLLPAGVSDPHVTLVGNGKMAGQATVDLDA